MRLTKEGLNLIKEFEGCRLEAYQDVAGIWTIGWGSTKDVTPGMKITQEEADRRLEEYLVRLEVDIKEVLPAIMNENQFSACVSLAYNIGTEAFKRSLLVRCCQKYNFDDAAQQFLRWVKDNGREIPGLVRRRKAEQKLFLS